MDVDSRRRWGGGDFYLLSGTGEEHEGEGCGFDGYAALPRMSVAGKTRGDARMCAC